MTNQQCQACDEPAPSGLSVCSIEGCEKPIGSRGWCHMHYCRWYRTGTTAQRPEPTHEDDIRRFLTKFRVGSMSECWIWTGTVVATYGQFLYEQTKKTTAHRYAHMVWIGPIPDGYQVDHVRSRGCTSRLCVNPFHLEAVTPLVNTQRKPYDFCIRGHDMSVSLMVEPSGRRRCRECRRTEGQRRAA